MREGTIEELERGVDFAMADADVSAQERLQIASDLILDAPLGELKEVIADVQALVGGEAVLAERLPAITRRFNHEKLAVAEGEAAKVVLCEQGELGDGLYFDAASARCVRVNHVDARILSAEGLEEKQRDAKVEDYRAQTQVAVGKYVSEAISRGCCAVHGVMTNGTIQISVSVSGCKLNTRNFWTGSWSSQWAIDVAEGGASGQGTLTGSIAARVHYFEDGNVHLTASRDFSDNLTWTDAASFAVAVAKAISTSELDYVGYLQGQYASLPNSVPDVAFKSLRRKMPITQQRFQWDKVAAYSLARELTSTS